MILSTTINAPPSIEKLFDHGIARQNNECLGAEDETVDWAILLRPFLELLVRVAIRDLIGTILVGHRSETGD